MTDDGTSPQRSRGRRQFLRSGIAAGIVSTSGCLSVVNDVGDAANDAWTCRTSQDDTERRETRWSPQKHPANPVIDGSSVIATQSYPPTVVRVDGRYYAVVKSWPNLVGFSSDDGIHWREDGVILEPDTDDGEGKLSTPLLRYDPAEETYHLYYKAVGSGGSAVDHVTSNRPTSGFTQDRSNPVYRPQHLERDLGVSASRVQLTDLIRVDGEFVFYGAVQRRGGEDFVWLGRGDDWTDVRITKRLFGESDDGVPGDILQSPQIIRIDSSYFLEYTAGWWGKDILDERRLYAAHGNSLDSLTPIDEPILRPGHCGAWDDRRVYAAQWLKRQDGEYLHPVRVDGSVRLYYSGHDLGTSKLTSNLGLTGLAEYSTFPRGQ